MTEQLDVRSGKEPDGLEIGQQAAVVVLADRRAALDRRVVVAERLQVNALEMREDVPPDEPLDGRRVRPGSRGERPGRVADASGLPLSVRPVMSGLRGICAGRAGEPQGQCGRSARHQSHESRTSHVQKVVRSAPGYYPIASRASAMTTEIMEHASL